MSASRHSESSDVFAAGLVLHYLLTVKKHPFAPNDETGKSGTVIQHETEGNIIKGETSIADSISPEAAHLLELMLNDSHKDRPSSVRCSFHPFFWSNENKVDFMKAVGDQPEFCVARNRTTAPSAVERDIEANVGAMFASAPWDGVISQVFADITAAPRSRRYVTSSAVDLVRFIRNSYAHVCDGYCSAHVKKLLLEDFVFSVKFPSLFIVVYKAVVEHGWDTRRENVMYEMSKVVN